MYFYFVTLFMILVLIALVFLNSNQLSFMKYLYQFLSNDQNKYKKFNICLTTNLSV